MRRSTQLAAGTLLAAALFSLSVLGSRPQPHSDATSDPAWLARVHSYIADREYQAHDDGSGLQAPNRRHDLRTFFMPSGIRVHDRTDAGSPQLLALRLERIGRGAERTAVPEGTLHAEGARVEIRRGDVTEWYENRPEGLEQGFTLSDFAASPGDESLVLELALDGAKASHRGDGLMFDTPTGRKLAYGELVAWDAGGRRLDAELTLRSDQRIEIALDDEGAVYPVT